MIKKLRNIINLTKIFFTNSFQVPNIISKKTKKISKKSTFIWLILIVIIAVIYISYEFLKYLIGIGQPTIFLNFLFIIQMTITIFQVIISSMNVYIFSKDIEHILPLPIKPIELLISKFNTLVINAYLMQSIFALIPIIMYGIFTYSDITFYIYSIIIFFIFPILPISIISIVMMIFMKLSKFIKNKDIFQIIITFIFIFLMFFLEFKIVSNVIIQNNGSLNFDSNKVTEQLNNLNDNITKVNKYFLQNNNCIELLINSNKINTIVNLIKIIFRDLIFFIIFIFIGKTAYLKNILKNNNFNKINKTKKINLKNISKKNKIRKAYIIKEFRNLYRSPIFFMQCVFPTIIIIVSIIIILTIAGSNIQLFLNNELIGKKENIFEIKTLSLIVAIIQIIFSFTNISITSVSREGKNANYMKSIPIDLYKQIIYKSIPQIIINTIGILIIIISINTVIIKIEFINNIYISLIAIILNLMSSILMVVVDLKNANLNWNSEYEVVKQNNTKLYQYVFTIISILTLSYFSKIFKNMNINLASIIIILILFILFILINILIKINKNKLFNKIK